MDGGGSKQSNEERGAEKLMDAHLKSLGLHRKKIAKDGSCLFRAVAEQVLHCQSLHTEVRAKCVEFLKQNREIYEAFIEGDFEDYLYKLQDPQQWVGEVEINALAVMYKRDFLIYQEPGKPAVPITNNNFKDKVRLCFLNGNHYDSVYPVSHIKNAALCQSILYELLYDGVFKVDKSSLSVCQRVARPADLLSDDNMAACGSSDESDLDTREALWVENGTSTTAPRHNNHSHRGRGRGRLLPERVRRSLNPTLFRNIEYDVWHKTKRAQHKLDYSIAAGMQFTAGDRCQVRLEGRNYNATIKEVPPNNGPVTVLIEDLGKKQVPLWSLRPPSDENSWSTVVNRDKRLSNGHGEWEERGKGRGRGKHVPASSSVSQATAPGSSGRVQKQHSWPPQATVEEQGGAKANRKSVSSVESAFGLTEEQRLAKEEEERNVALVEIQLRDEHSFPALGTQPGMQGDGGRKKGGEKRRSQRNKTKSPVEDVRAPSPSAGERPKSSTPPLAAAATTALPTNTTSPTNPTPPAAKRPAAAPANSESNPARLSSLKAATANANMAAAAAAAATASSSTSSLPPTCDAPTAKTNAQSYASAAGAPPSSPPAAPSTKPSAAGGAVPPSVPSSASLFSFLTPVLPAASSPPTPQALPSSSPPLPPKPSASPPPSSSLPPPTFIAPIAPSPAAAQGFLPPSSLPRSSPPVSTLPHSPSPPSFSSSSAQNSSSSSSLIHQAAQVHEAPPVSTQTPNSLPTAGGTLTGQESLSQIHPQVPQNQSQISVSQTQTQASLTQGEPSLPQNQISMPQTQTEAQSSLPQSCLPHLQHQPQSHTEGASPQTQILPPALQTSLPQAQTSGSHLQPQSQVQYLSQSQSEVAQVQSSHPAPGASYPLTSQASLPVSGSVQPSVTHPHHQVQPVQPPHPSQVPHPSLSLSASPTHPSLQSQTPNTQNQTEASLPPAQPAQPPPGSPAHAPSHPPHPSQHPQSLSAHPLPPPHPQSIPGGVPLQQLSQLYQDPLYPGFPQGEKGDMAPVPSYSSSKSGDDLPQDINILRFFFNLGVKAFTVPMFPPYIYLYPLQQAHTVHPKLHSRSPSPTPHYPPSNPPTPTPHYPPPNPTTRHQEAYLDAKYPPTSASMPPQYDHQASLTEPPYPSDPSSNQAGYLVAQPPPHRMPLQWQQHQIPPLRSTSFPVGYPTPSPPYPVPPPLSQVYHPSQGPGHPMYPPYPPSSLGYQSSSAPEELQMSQGVMEQRQPANGDTMSGQGPSRVPGLLESPANTAKANNNRTVSSFALKKDQAESLSGAVLLVDPPLNNIPILVSNHGVKDVSMTTMKPRSSSGSPSPYDIISKTTFAGDINPSRAYRARKPPNPTNTYVALEPGQVSYLPTTMEALSVGCNTEEDWEEQMGFKPPTLSHRGPRKYRGGGGGGGGGRGRGHDPGRGPPRRRYGGEAGAGHSFVQFNSSYRGRGRERGY